MYNHNISGKLSRVVIFFTALLVSPLSSAVTLEELAEKMDKLEAENHELRGELQELKSGQVKVMEKQESQSARASKAASGGADFVNVKHKYSYDMLDPTTKINRKQLHILEQKQSGELQDNSVTLGGAVTAIADIQKSDRDSKFGYLMRHPTSSNQIGKDVSEAVVHSVQLGITATLGSWFTAYSEILYDPEQSFGQGTITDLNRNQLQLRRGYVLIGNLDKSPFYLSLGKMATPFGLTDTVNPFTASTVWHAFGGLSYGIKGGYYKNGLNIELMAAQGGAQFRAANTSVNGTNIPSKLNNVVADINYTFGFGNENAAMVGASYERGSPYCQGFPVVHFTACEDNNAAYDFYGQLNMGNFEILAEYAKTAKEWPGTFNPAIPEFSAHKVTSWGLGGKYKTSMMGKPLALSAEFSRFEAGPSGAPWDRQDQTVLGIASFVTSSVKLFGEYIHVDGYAPLNFVSGGNLGVGQTHSDRDADSDILMFGVNAAY
ncbi:MAG: hypothetical protein AB8D52_03245 [Gammaproteobacteria bacterium]